MYNLVQYSYGAFGPSDPVCVSCPGMMPATYGKRATPPAGGREASPAGSNQQRNQPTLSHGW